ncbi:MAG: hypothetical protein QOE14_2059 [Humisphaera sp.]|nr:hypothetical protein [Humisphaera sp.]
MSHKFITILLVASAILVGCRKDSAAAEKPTAVAATPARQAGPNDVTLRIRKLGGADGKQVMNKLTVVTPIGDDFTVTEQVGTTQLELRGKVVDLKDGKYRVSYDYTETSASGQQKLKSLIELQPNTEKEIGGIVGGEGTERIVLSLARP